MVNRILATSLLATLTSYVLAAGQYTPPVVWECDAPGTEGYFLSEKETPFDGAADACAQLGGYLADITNQNFLFSTDLVRNCVGENENAWIRSWDYNPTNPQDRRCLALYVGFTGPGGGIDLECEGSRYALCMTSGKRTHALPNGNVRNYGFANPGNTVTVTKTVQMVYSSAMPVVQFSNYFVSYEEGSSIPQSLVVVSEAPIPTISSSVESNVAEVSPTALAFSLVDESADDSVSAADSESSSP